MFKGPLGLWPFPILNLILALLSRSNVEIWEFTDCEGNLRRIVVYRQVEPSWLKYGAHNWSSQNMAFSPNQFNTPDIGAFAKPTHYFNEKGKQR